MSATWGVRAELDQRGTRARHTVPSEGSARGLLMRLDRRLPGWLDAGPVGGEAGHLRAAEAVRRALVDYEERRHPDRGGDGTSGCYCIAASWLERSSTTRLWATLRHDGTATWRCRQGETWWLVYLQAGAAKGRPAYREPADAADSRPQWRPTQKP